MMESMNAASDNVDVDSKCEHGYTEATFVSTTCGLFDYCRCSTVYDRERT